MKCISINNQIKRVSNSEAARLVCSAQAAYVGKETWKKLGIKPPPVIKEETMIQSIQADASDDLSQIIQAAKRKPRKSNKKD